MNDATPHRSFRKGESALRAYLDDAHALAVCRSHRLELQLTCLRADNFQSFAETYGHHPAFDAPIRLYETLETQTNSEDVFRCYQYDGFVTPKSVSIPTLTQSFADFPIAHAVVSVSIPVETHRHRQRVVEWVLMHLHRGIVEAIPNGKTIVCTAPPDLRAT